MTMSRHDWLLVVQSGILNPTMDSWVNAQRMFGAICIADWMERQNEPQFNDHQQITCFTPNKEFSFQSAFEVIKYFLIRTEYQWVVQALLEMNFHKAIVKRD